MRVLRLIPPGRFPTVIHDPGQWVAAAREAGAEVVSESLSHGFWRTVCSPAVKPIMLETLTAAQRLRRRVAWRSEGFDFAAGARLASAALDAFRKRETFESAARYQEAVAPLAAHLEAVNRGQDELTLTIELGPVVSGLDYHDSSALVRYASGASLLARLIEAALAPRPTDFALAVLGATSPYDLLTGIIAALRLRERYPGVHLCLADHGYENFSLQPHLETLRHAGTLDTVFDTIVESKDERDIVLPAIIERVAAGNAPRGFVRADGRDTAARLPTPAAAAPTIPAFTSEPVLWTRLSSRRCYWSKCTFCVQNMKYEDPRPPARAEVEGALDRIAANVRAGVRTFIFSDEAVSPAFLGQLCQGIASRGLSFRWACRCKLELAFDRALFRSMRATGCFEILIGLESISPRVLTLMGKHVKGLGRERTAAILRDAAQEGIGLHINLIGGFPGDTPADARDTVDFVIDVLKDARGATYALNRFALFPDTPIARDPEAFGIIPLAEPGDMPATYPFELRSRVRDGTAAATALIPDLRRKLDTALGWQRLGEGAAAAAARSLYFSSGHGALLKAQADNPYANPLRDWRGRAA